MKNSEYGNSNSTVFSDPKKKGETPKKPKGKIILIVVAVLLVLFVAVPWLIVKVANSGDGKRPVTPFSSRVEATKADQMAISLFELKNSDIRNNDANSKILSALPMAGELGGFTFSLKTDSKPYRLTLSFNDSHDTSLEDWYKTALIKYSCVLLALIENADEIGWSYPNETGAAVTEGYFTRADAEKFLKTPVSYYAESSQSIQLLLNELGIE